MKKIFTAILFIFLWVFLPVQGRALTLSGSILASTVTINGDVTVSSMTISTLTVTNLLTMNGNSNGIKGVILQTISTSTTASAQTTSSTLTAIPGLSVTIAMLNPNDYVRISLSGLLETANSTTSAHVSIKRDSIDLGAGGFSTATNSPGIVSVGIIITDSPGDTSTHTYTPTFNNDSGTEAAIFTANPLAYFLVEEVSR